MTTTIEEFPAWADEIAFKALAVIALDAEALDALPVGSKVIDIDGDEYVKEDSGRYYCSAEVRGGWAFGCGVPSWSREAATMSGYESLRLGDEGRQVMDQLNRPYSRADEIRRDYRGPLIAGLYECRRCGAAVFDTAKHDLEHHR